MFFSKRSVKGGLADVSVVIWPLIFAMASNAVMQFTDRMFLARYSEAAIRASLPAGVLSFTLISFFQTVVAYSGTFVAQFHGAKERVACVRAMGQGLWLASFCIIPILCFIPIGGLLMALAGHAPEVIVEERKYYDILMLGGVVLPFAAAVTGFFTGRGLTKITMLANIIGSGFNIGLDWILIFGKFGFPALGIQGAALATVISSLIPLTLLSFLAWRDPIFRKVGFRRGLTFDWELLKKIVLYGIPSGVHTLMDVSLFTMFVMMTGSLVPMESVVSNSGFSINHLVFAPLLGISMGASVMVGQYQGAKNSDAAWRAGWSSMKFGWGYMTLMAILLISFSLPLFSAFYPPDAQFTKEAFTTMGRSLVLLMVSWGFFDVLTIVLGGALKGAGDTRFVMIYMTCMGWGLWFPVNVWILKNGGGLLTLWRWMTLYTIMLSFGIIWRWMKGKWRNIELVSGNEEARMQ